MVFDELNKWRIILASRSPRRQQLLSDLGLRFEIVTKDWSEDYPSDLKGAEIALYVAEKKARSFETALSDNELIITADTIVWCNGKVLDKPVDHEDAKRIIREISGNTHEVITAVCLLSVRKKKTFSSSTKVTFDNLSEEEVDFYIREFRPFDKAGAYGIQEWIGIAACSRIEGSYFNVMGLPVHRLFQELKTFVK